MTVSMITDRVKFAKRLIAEMERAGVNSRHLAAVTRIPAFVIDRWRDGQGTPTPLAISQLAAALHVPAARFTDHQ